MTATIAMVGLTACGGAQRVRPRGDEYLAAIRLEGSRAIPNDEILPGLALSRTLSAGRALDPYQLSLDADRIRAAYVRKGFLEVRVIPNVETRTEGKVIAQTAVFTIAPGRRARLAVAIRGLPPEVPPARARALIGLPDGAPFSYEVYDLAKAPLVELIEDAGYPQVTVDAAVLADRATGIATARFDVVPGPRAVFGEVTLEGVDGGLAAAVRGRLSFRPGEAYSARALTRSQRAVLELGRFSTVRFVPDRTRGAVVPIKIAVARANLRSLTLGAGAAIGRASYEVRARIGYDTVVDALPLWNFGTDLRPSVIYNRALEVAQFRARLRGRAYRQDLFRPRVRGELEASLDYLGFEAYTVSGPQARAALSAPLLTSWLQARAGWVLEYRTFSDVRVAPLTRDALGLDRGQRRGAYELALDIDLRDTPIETTRGVFVSLRGVLGTPFAGSAMRYAQLTPEVRGYVPLGRAVLAARARLGILVGDVPVTERYFSGGPSGHRAFAERQLSPFAPGIVDGRARPLPIGGEGLLEVGAELRIPLGTVQEFPLGVELFLDGGAVTEAAADLKVSALAWAPGIGVYASVFGIKVRLGVAELLTQRTRDGTYANLGWYVAVGDAY